MKAVVITGSGGPEVLEIRHVPAPEPGGGEVRVRVRAAGLNRADLMQAQGRYPAPPGSPRDIPGLEFAGEVESFGPGCASGIELGDRVFGIVGGGGMAELVTCHERMAVPIPANLDFEQAAAVPEGFITAFDALQVRGELKPGERVLIHAAAGGVGTAAVQLAHVMGCTVFGTSRTADKLQRVCALGLDFGIDSSRQDFAAEIRQKTRGAGVHVVLDHLGAPAIAGNLDALTTRGRLVIVGLLAGSKAEIDLATMLRKRLTVVGTTLRARPLDEKIAATRLFAECVLSWLERGLVWPVVDRVFDFDQVRSAEERMVSNVGFGKIVLRV
jgi:putative PIG3 family NAD(P)H quinone oxidoreductase